MTQETNQMTVEVIARRWCALTGEDPDKVLTHWFKDTEGQSVQQDWPYWKIVSQEIVPMFAWIRCFAEFAQQQRADAPRIQIPS